MYGTVARMRLLPGKEQEMLDLVHTLEAVVPGYLGETIYRLDSGGNEYMLAAVFADKQAYVANAESPEMDERYRKLRALMAEDPEWHDGEIVYHYSA
jgi:antibiotic biosynthesis monooxygenase (ABM) superfamily enzyme